MGKVFYLVLVEIHPFIVEVQEFFWSFDQCPNNQVCIVRYVEPNMLFFSYPVKITLRSVR